MRLSDLYPIKDKGERTAFLKPFWGAPRILFRSALKGGVCMFFPWPPDTPTPTPELA